MQRDKISQDRSPKPADTSGSAAAADWSQNESDFVPDAEEVARRAYFSYLNQGSKPGQAVQHWLAAEAELLAERNLTRVHGFHNHPKS